MLTIHLTPQDILQSYTLTAGYLSGFLHTQGIETLFETLAFLILIVETGMVVRKGFQPPYRLCRLRDFSGDLQKRWCIEYHAWCEASERLKRRQVWVSSAYQTKKERRAWADATMRHINAQLVQGYYLPDQKAPQQITLATAIDEYIEWKARQVRRVTDYSGVLKMFLEYFAARLENPLLSEITKGQVMEFLDDTQRRRGWANITRNVKKGYLHNFFAWFADREQIEKNPAANIQDLKTAGEARYLPFNDYQLADVRKALREENNELYLFSQFIYYTFIRPKELRHLRIGDIDLQANRIRIPATVAKSKRTQHVQVPAALRKLIMHYDLLQYPKGWYVFGNQGRPGPQHYSPNTVTRRMRVFLDSHGYSRDYSLYSFKHTGCCRLYQLTKDIKLVSSQCRHTSVQTTEIYLRSLGMFQDRTELDDFV